MAGETHTEQNQINWAERYIMELSKSMDSIKEDMRELRGMEARLSDRMERMDAKIDKVNDDLNTKIDTANKHAQILAVTVSIGILAAIITVVIAFGKSMGL